MNIKLLSRVAKASLYSMAFIAVVMIPDMVLDRFIPRELHGLIPDYAGYGGFLALIIVAAALIWLSVMLEDHILGMIPLILSYSIFVYLLSSTTHNGLYITHYGNLSIEINFKQLIVVITASIIFTLSIKISKRLFKLKY
ncbi:MAG: hypothetical protein N3E44_06010 [Candidatus Bathyarchaeota archaeon]|nr:hypothetical protein [Candidatus Bathyarchaeota archaeon]